MDRCKKDFGDDFIWGVSTAAYQIEGAHNTDGKGASIWDTFVQKKNKIFGKQDANVACDFYNRYAADLALMRRMNIPNYRFSIAWSRILPQGTGEINGLGIDFYNRIIDLALELGITPWVTLYHWDLPQALEDKGGWTNRDVKDWFADYVAICVKHFGDRVKNWIVINEPTVFTGAGYFFGVHAPGKKGFNNFLAAAHHTALAQAGGARIIKSLQTGSNVGTSFSCSHIEPYTARNKDKIAAAKADALLNRFFIEPLLGMGYPTQEIKALRKIEKYMQQNDEANLQFNMDFIGIQNYTREIIRHTLFVPFLQAKIVSAQKRKVETTAMNWEVYPESIYEVLKKYSSYANIPPLIITENGAAFTDELVDCKVHDPKRKAYLQQAIEQVYRAKNKGLNVHGYFVWTFLDNFEWAEGYRPRFGLVHVDFENQKRIVKSSGKWYADFLK
ncbi:GH1 family beta-glucosidase [Sphingobacterium sp. UT-1RO-CII-1]|uniref:GH1 family beta-glucosidase n=1 Tax=Sphingobacterium sp. UT-1RO-CII-1 TaxID=2995225 RepID=UPI00227BAB4C|nr:GH1 family beta-glucosidase [Sphingobacterium sp. UT-1RO-CII-1]MCY4778893.1 GH1 family beta-glucosidase [Sphingobacterium sp. UT-1RO-CII-1]